MSDTTSDPLIDALFGKSQQFGRYTLAHRVAQGGMASVYLAQLAATDGFQKWFALKVIHPHLAGNPKFERMFAREAQLASRLSHPNVCQVVDFGQHEGSYYLVMEYLHGESLGTVQRRALHRTGGGQGAGVPLPIAARIVADAARGLHAAHELRNADGSDARVVHRDVSPSNIFVLYDGVSKVVDFGIAHFRESTDERTATEELRGKIAYMAPEQLARKPVDRRTDVWALGVVLWEITLGRRLFKRDSEIETIVAVSTAPIPRPSRVKKGYPAELEKVVMRALERDPAQRTATVGEMADALERWISRGGEPVGTPQVAGFMREMFGDRIRSREEILRRGAAGAMPGAEGEWTDASLGGGPVPAGPPALETLTADERATWTPPRRVGRGRAALVVAGLVAVASAGLAVVQPWRARSNAASAARAVVPPAPSALVPVAAAARESEVVARESAVVGPAQPLAPPLAPPLPPPSSIAPDASARVVPTKRGPVAAAETRALLVAAANNAASRASGRTPRGSTPRPATDARAVPDAGTTPPHVVASNTAPASGVEGQPSQTTLPASPVQDGFLNLMAQPTAAEVFEGSVLLGRTPFVRRRIRAGHHRLRLVPPGGDERIREIDVVPGEVSELSVRWP